MASVYFDTNVFLDFYRRSGHPLAVFQDLKKLGTRLLFTEQTIQEFERNRAQVLAATIKDLATLDLASNLPADVIGTLPEFKEYGEARKRVTTLIESLKGTLKTYLTDDESDPVLVGFRELTKSARTLPTTNENIESAQRRKLLGHPPSSPDKITIGDELIWETLLGGCADDLIVCTKDKTFHTNEPVLRGEFHRRRGKLLTVSSDLAAVIKGQGEDDSLIKKEEEALAAQRKQAEELQAALVKHAQSEAGARDRLAINAYSLRDDLARTDGDEGRYSHLAQSLKEQQEKFENSGLAKLIKQQQELMESSGIAKLLKDRQELMESSGIAKLIKDQQELMENSGIAKLIRDRQELMESSGIAKLIKQQQELIANLGLKR